MLADADLPCCEDLGKIFEQSQPRKRPCHMAPRAGGCRCHPDAPLCQKCQQLGGTVLGRDLVVIVVLQHLLDARSDLLCRHGQRVPRLQVGRPLLHTHGKEDLIQARLRRNAKAAQIPRPQIVPDAHGIQHNAVQIKDRTVTHAASSPLPA